MPQGVRPPLSFPLLLALAALLFLNTCREEKMSGTELAPDFKLTFFYGDENLNGKEIRPADFRGKPAAIFFTASYCTTCEFMFNTLAPYRSQNFFIMSVGVLDDETRFRRKVESLEVKIPVAFDTDNMAEKYDTDILPITVFITPEGTIYKKVRGTIGHKRLERLFNELKNANVSQSAQTSDPTPASAPASAR